MKRSGWTKRHAALAFMRGMSLEELMRRATFRYGWEPMVSLAWVESAIRNVHRKGG